MNAAERATVPIALFSGQNCEVEKEQVSNKKNRIKNIGTDCVLAIRMIRFTNAL